MKQIKVYHPAVVYFSTGKSATSPGKLFQWFNYTLSAGKQAFISKLNLFDFSFCPSGPVLMRLTLG